MIENREKVINKYNDGSFVTGYLDDDCKFIPNSFDGEPTAICKDGTKYWYKDGKKHRDNNLPAVIWSDGDIEYYKNDKRYWIINNEEYYSYEEVQEKFKNNIFYLPSVNTDILKENGIDIIYINNGNYIILDQAQYNLSSIKIFMIREKVINDFNETGYISNKPGKFILHSFDDEPIINTYGTKAWFKDGLRHRDNNLPAVIYSVGNYSFYKNDERYWIINDTEYYNYEEVKEKFKNKILDLPNVNINILKENNIDAICIDHCNYIILDQTQYNLAILKFL